ncbi:MAG TPA: class I SAM-dependent methyltransferase [Dermatophilaceae bacterium]|jgi:16S rRNA A1518/A1519 N6-dimethyltransferase RsmA/KsgA/DIM1 with predicted DNA glycosylase/AP lyase activity
MGRGALCHRILDIGAGTGHGTLALSKGFPSEIVAVEPDQSVRAVLMLRIADRRRFACV